MFLIDSSRPNTFQITRQQFRLTCTSAWMHLHFGKQPLYLLFRSFIPMLFPPIKIILGIGSEFQFHTSSALMVTQFPFKKSSRPRFTLATISGS